MIEPRLMTIKESGVYLGRSSKFVSSLIARGELPVIDRGLRRKFVDREELETWIRKAKQVATPAMIQMPDIPQTKIVVRTKQRKR